MKPDWRIYYADGSTFDSTEGEPWQAPSAKVILINQKDFTASNGVSRVSGRDYFIWKHNRWFDVTFDALMLYLFMDQFEHPRAALAGEMVLNNIWQDIVRIAAKDKDFYK